MIQKRIDAAMGRIPFDLLIRNVQVVNVFSNEIAHSCVGIADGYIVHVGKDEDLKSLKTVDGGNCYLLPGFIDAHMHLESSMLSPTEFSRLALANGTTTVAADPHEIGNVLGVCGVKTLKKCTEGLPFRVLMMAPSTIPSLPGFEGSGFEVNGNEAAAMLGDADFAGLGEVMDFHGVSSGDKKMVAILEAAEKSGKLVDGHASILTGEALQAFRAAGIDSDHTPRTGEKIREEIALGFCVQIQACVLNEDIVKCLNDAPAQENICLVTDDVCLPVLLEQGHLNAVYAKAVGLGLDVLKAVRYTTINPARRLRQYDIGAVVPGMRADLQFVESLSNPKPVKVFFGGMEVCLPDLKMCVSENQKKALRHSMNVAMPLTKETFALPEYRENSVLNVIHQDGKTCRTEHRRLRVMSPEDYTEKVSALTRMAVINRYGIARRGLALIDGFENFRGAVAITFGHDCHNLSVFGSNEGDMVIAARRLCQEEGGICAVEDGIVRAFIALPLGGLMSDQSADTLYAELKDFNKICSDMGLIHENILSFLTLMPLAVSPEIKCTDMGLLNVNEKKLISLLETDSEEAMK